MPITVSSAFRAELQKQNPSDILRVFTFVGSDHSDSVLDYGSISRRGDRVSAGDLSMRVSNADQRWNVLQTDKSHFTGSGTLQMGFTINNSKELISLFSGKLTRYKDSSNGKGEVSFRDQLDVLNTRTIGDDNIPILFTNSFWNPADMFWTIATSWGQLSSVKSTSNSDIDYSSWLDYRSRSAELGFQLQAKFNGDTVATVFQLLGEITETVIVGEGDGKIYTSRIFPTSLSQISSYHDGKITNIVERSIETSQLINDATILIGYNPDSGTWSESVTKVVTSSVNTYGSYGKLFDSTVIWHVGRTSGFSFLDHLLLNFSDPPENIRMNALLEGQILKINDSITITDAIMSYSARQLRVTKVDIDLNTCETEIAARSDGILDISNWFILDHPTNGILDQSNNPIY